MTAFEERQLAAFRRMLPLCPDHRDKQHGKPCLACEIEELQLQLRRVRVLAAQALCLARNGDYCNGVTDPTGMLDEGSYKVDQILRSLLERAAELHVVVGATIFDCRDQG